MEREIKSIKTKDKAIELLSEMEDLEGSNFLFLGYVLDDCGKIIQIGEAYGERREIVMNIALCAKKNEGIKQMLSEALELSDVEL